MDLQPDKATFRHAVVEIRDLNSIYPGLNVVAAADNVSAQRPKRGRQVKI